MPRQSKTDIHNILPITNIEVIFKVILAGIDNKGFIWVLHEKLSLVLCSSSTLNMITTENDDFTFDTLQLKIIWICGGKNVVERNVDIERVYSRCLELEVRLTSHVQWETDGRTPHQIEASRERGASPGEGEGIPSRRECLRGVVGGLGLGGEGTWERCLPSAQSVTGTSREHNSSLLPLLCTSTSWPQLLKSSLSFFGSLWFRIYRYSVHHVWRHTRPYRPLLGPCTHRRRSSSEHSDTLLSQSRSPRVTKSRHKMSLHNDTLDPTGLYWPPRPLRTLLQTCSTETSTHPAPALSIRYLHTPFKSIRRTLR